MSIANWPKFFFFFVLFSDTETANPLVAEFEDDLSSSDELPVVVQPKLLENPLSKQTSKPREILELNFANASPVPESCSPASIEQELRLDPTEGNSDTFDSWLGQDSKWRQSPEGGEDMGSDVFETRNKNLDANVNLELLDNSGVHRNLSSDEENFARKEKKKQKDDVMMKILFIWLLDFLKINFGYFLDWQAQKEKEEI